MAMETYGDASNDEERERAEKILEVAGVYEVYQSYLDQEHIIDFGDLIAKSVQLLIEHQDIQQEVQSTFRHILVDEYQDVNRACAVLLQQLAGNGKGLWVVGDARQSIYRFRGASPQNMAVFPKDFPGAITLSLQVNYRSQSPVINVFSTLARQMAIPTVLPFVDWKANRPDEGGVVLLKQVDNLEAEGKSVASEIHQRVKQGILYKDQAILCRSHTQLSKMAALMEKYGVPTLYIGDLFERPEIQDLLALISLVTGDERGLVRVYLQNHATTYGAWYFLANYLFNDSSYLRTIMQSDGNANYHQRIAIYQFLRFAYEQDRAISNGGNPKRRLLDYVRRLEIHGEEKQLRQIPEAGHSLDAVRLLTIHGSKGLEFRAVYVPMLGKGHFPSKRQGQVCYHPNGLVAQDPRQLHSDEEICLFFVAVSRARDILCLSRATRYSGRGSNPSEFISIISSAVIPSTQAESVDNLNTAVLLDTNLGQEEDFQAVSSSDFEVNQLDLYLRCPRKYYYDLVLGFSRNTEDPPFLRLHHCVDQVIDWIAKRYLQMGYVDTSLALDKLDALWPAADLDGHPFDTVYRKNAENIVIAAVQLYSGSHTIKKAERIPLRLKNGTVHFLPDHIEVRDDGRHIFRKIRTGQLKRDEVEQGVYGLYHAAARQIAGDAFDIEVVSLASEAVLPIQLTEQKAGSKLDEYDQTMGRILEGKFPPEPKDVRYCPRCPNYFICPTIPVKQATTA